MSSGKWGLWLMRYVLPTLLSLASVPFEENSFDGRNMVSLVSGRTPGWREFIDLEHDLCYDRSNHWNALTDGKFKYIQTNGVLLDEAWCEFLAAEHFLVGISERNNVVEQHKEIAGSLAEIFAAAHRTQRS